MIITFRVSDEQAWAFRVYATEKGITMSELIRSLLKEQIKKDNLTNPVLLQILEVK